ncbi:MAG: hypothetical protein ABI451_11710 [Dokdonella sp.]
MVKKKFNSAAAIAIATTAVTAMSGNAFAAVLCNTFTTPLSIPQNIDGVYINLVTGAQGTAGSGVAGWDVNMYATGASSLYFFWPTPGTSAGGVATNGTVYDYLAAGQPVGVAQTFILSSGGGGEPPFANYRVTQSGGYLGVRFLNEVLNAWSTLKPPPTRRAVVRVVIDN